MPCQLSDEINYVNDDVFSYMCNLAMEKCSRKMEKKKASCGGAAMRKRLLIKNFVAQMLAQEKQTREQSLLNESDDDFTLKSLDSSYIFSSASAGNQSISPEMEIDEDEEQHLETGDDEEEEEESELNKSHLEDEDEDDEEESKDENIGNREDQEAEAAAATIMATNGKANSGFVADNNNNNGRLIDNSLRLFRSQSDKMEDLVDEEDGNERASLHNLLSITSHKEKPPCWRNVKIHQREDEDDDDEFHKVPTPERQKLYWQNTTNNEGDESSAHLFNHLMQDQPQNDGKMRIDESSSQAAAVIEIAPNLVGSPLTDHTVADWRYFDDSTAIHVNFITTGQFRTPVEDAAYFLANENILSLNDDDDHHSPMKISQEDETKLFLLERAGVDGEMDAQHSQLAGLVNMVPSSFKFNFGPTRPSHCLTELENVNKLADTYFRHHQLGNRKRPWSLVFDDQMMDIQQEMSTPSHFPQSFTTPSETATLLSPLCCGLLQLQPFNGATADLHNGLTTEGAVPQTQPLMKRVKL